MPYIKLKTDFVNVDVEFTEKVIFVSGFSGEGKSLLVQEIENALPRNLVDTDLSVEIVSNSINDFNRLCRILSEQDEGYSTVMVSDEKMASKVLDFIKGKSIYAFIITRKNISSWNYSYRSLYKAIREGGVTNIQPTYKVNTADSGIRYDCIITEDDKAGYNFVKEYCTSVKVIPANGKDKVQQIFMSVASDYKNILILIDAGGMGSVIAKLLRVISLNNKEQAVKFLLAECFEHVLLCSGFIGWDKDIFKYFDIKYDNTENFCECKVSELTEGKPFEYNHKVQELGDCWRISCEKCSMLGCTYKTECDKKEFILKGGPWGFLKEIR